MVMLASLTILLLLLASFAVAQQFSACNLVTVPCYKPFENTCIQSTCDVYVAGPTNAPYFCQITTDVCRDSECNPVACQQYVYLDDNSLGPFTITLSTVGFVPADALVMFVKAALFWTKAVQTSGIPTFSGGSGFPAVQGMGIRIEFPLVDAPGGNFVATTNQLIQTFDLSGDGTNDLYFTRWSFIQYDRYDWEVRDQPGFLTTAQWELSVKHEMMHSIGFGQNWAGWGLTDGRTVCPQGSYKGAQGTAEYVAAGGLLPYPPIQNTTGGGGRCNHWRETSFDRELMTGVINSVPPTLPLSRISLASLKDLGHTVDLSYADPYTLFSPNRMVQMDSTRERSVDYKDMDLSSDYPTIVMDYTGNYAALEDSGVTLVLNMDERNRGKSEIMSAPELSAEDAAKLKNMDSLNARESVVFAVVG